MPVVTLPKGEELEFPDGMSDDDMRSAIERNFPQYARTPAPPPPIAQPPAPRAAVPDPTRPIGRSLGVSFSPAAPAIEPDKVLDRRGPAAAPTAADARARAEWDSLSDQGQAKAMDAMRIDAGRRNSGTIAASPETGVISRVLDRTVRKPMDNSLGGALLETAGDAARGVVKASNALGQSGWGGVQAAADAVGAEGLSDLAGESVKAGERNAISLTNKRDPSSITERIFESTFTSVPLALGVAGAPLRALMAQSAAQEYGQSRARGLDGNAASERAVWMGLAEGIGERFGMPQLQQLFARAASGATGKELGRILGDMLVREQVGEQVTTALQSGYEAKGTYGMKPDATLADYLNDAVETAKVTFGQSLLTGGLAGGVKRAAGKQSRASELAGALDGDINESAEEALNRAIDSSPYGIARRTGFHVDPPLVTDQPVARRKKLEDLFRNAAATVGMSPGAVDAAVKAAQGRPLSDISGFFSRFARSARARGLSGADLDPAVSAALEHGPLDATPQHKASAIEALLDDGTGLEDAGAAELPALVQDGQSSEGAGGSQPIPEPAPTVVDERAHAAATSPTNQLAEPTPAQKEAGNYAKGHVRIAGMDLAIENPQGSVRRGVDRDGKAWESTLASHYGYIKGTMGNDKDHVDAFVKPGTAPDYAGPVFVVDQVHPDTGKFDEHKVVLGASDEAEAESIYRANYAKDWQGLASITRLPMQAFKSWVRDGAKRQPLGDIREPNQAPSAQAAPVPQAQQAPAPQGSAAAPVGGAEPAGVPATGPAPAQAARVTKKSKRAKLDPERDTLLQAVAKLGGFGREEIAREFGMKPEELKQTVQVGNLRGFPFRKTGGLSIDSVAEQLREAGYFDGVADDEIRIELENAVFEELGGRPRLSTLGQMRSAEQRGAEAQAEAEALTQAEQAEWDALTAKAGTTPAGMDSLEDDDIPGFDDNFSTDPRALAAFLGETYDEAIHDQQARTDAQERPAQADAQEDRRPAERGSRAPAAAGGQAPGPADPAEGLTLTSPTREELSTQAARDAGAAATEAAEQKRLTNKARADAELDEFTLTGSDSAADLAAAAGQGGLFDAPAPAPASKSSRATSTKPEKGDSDEVRKAKADALRALGDLADILGKPGRLGILPEQEQKLMPVLTRLMDAAFRLGYLKFKEAAKFALDQIRAALGDEVADAITIDHLQGAYIGMAGRYRDQGADRPAAVAAVDSKAEIENQAATADTSPQEPSDAPSARRDLERDRQDPAARDADVAPAVRAGSGSAAEGTRSPGDTPGAEGGRPAFDPGVPVDGAPARGERSDQLVRGEERESGPAGFPAGADLNQRGAGAGKPRVPAEPIATEHVAQAAESGLRDGEKRRAQRLAESVPVKPGDLANIRETLPYLLPEQQDDVHKAEARFAVPDGYGMLFTNGTGTGKTFTGLGIVKRHARQGNTDILIAVPDGKIMADWVDSGRALGLDITALQNTTDAGSGITITTYANLGMNDSLAGRSWDLIVPDEAHQLMQSADGDESLALKALRAISMHPRGSHDRYSMLNRADIEALGELSKQIDANDKILGNDDTMAEVAASLRAENATLRAKHSALSKKLDAARIAVSDDVQARQGAQRTRVTFLSATPFAYEKTIDWAEGYLFDYAEGQPPGDDSSGYSQARGYNGGDNRERFFMQHFGYRMRYNKLTQPDAKVDSGLMQRQFNSWLKKRGALSGRQLDVAADYDRKFVLVDSAVGNEIDRAIEWIGDKDKATREALKEKKDEGVNGFELLAAELRERLYSKQGHLVRRYLLEAIKAKEVVQHVRDHMAMGRKVVVFHDFKKGGATNPFDFPPVHASQIEDEDGAKRAAKAQAFNAAAAAFRAEFPSLTGDKLLADLLSPIARFTQEFPGVLLINGNEKPGDLLARYKAFQDDATGPVVALVQSAKNKGWSGHDTTGKHQRVLFNLGLPTQPTMSIQQEGRIYRTGQVSNAMFRYLNTGTNWERWAFAQTIAERASAAENLGSGELARALKDAFISGFEESGDYPAGHDGEGTGGKARDRAANTAITAYDRARSFYFGTAKKTSKTKAQEGTDYFATPEPVGFKMVEWADLRGGEDALEPSGGHGAIARWFPENVNRTAIEPSSALGSRMAMVFDGKIIRGDFEGLHVSNKYDAIVMNPPFGTAGRMAIDHLAKAATHLREGGRVVALIPTGPAADKKFDAWFYEEQKKPVKPVAVHPTHGEIYVGDNVETRASFAPAGRVVSGTPDNLMLKLPGVTGTTQVSVAGVQKVDPTGPRTASFRPTEGFHLVADIRLPQVTFERAGTSVATRIVIIDKLAKDQAAPAQVSRDYSNAEDINELFDRLENSEIPKRTKPVVEEVEPPKPVGRNEAAKAEARAAAVRGAEVAKSTGQEIVEHVTGKGKTLRGVVRTDLLPGQAKQVDEYTFKKDGGWFIREKHIERLAELFPDPKLSLADEGTTNAAPSTPAGNESDAVRVAARVQSFVDRATGRSGEHRVIPVDGADASPELRSARALARGVFGNQVQFVRLSSGPLFHGLMLPAESGGKPITVIDVGTPKPVMAVLGHELTHSLRVSNPDIYEDLKARLDKVMKSNAPYAQQLNARRAKRGLGPLSDDVLAEERIADVVGDQFTEPAFWRDLAHVNASGWRRLADAILGFIDNVLSKLTKRRPFGSDAYVRDLRAARAAVVDAMSAFASSQGAATANAETRLSLDGDDDVKLSLADKTPEQREALARAGIGGQRTIKTRIRLAFGRAMDLLQSRDELFAEFRQGALDQFHGIRRAVARDLGGLTEDQDPYVAARLANGGTSSVMRGLLLHGQARWTQNGQHLEKVPGSKGLLDILAPLGNDVEDFFGWMIGNRAARLMKEGRENNFTVQQIATLQGLGASRRAEFVKIAAEYSAFKRSVLDIAEGAGLIDPVGRKVWDHADYIPFYRQIDERSTFSPTGRRGLAGQSSGVRTLKGGEAALNDPVENLLMNFSRLVDASLKNNAVLRTVDALQDGGSFAVEKVGYDMAGAVIPTSQVKRFLIEAGAPEQALDAVPSEAFEGMAKMWAIKAPTDPDVVRVMRDGKPEFYKVHDPLLLRALTSFVPFDFPGLGAARAFKRLLTATVTATPDFMLRNFVRDSAAAHAITREGFNPVKSLTGIGKSFTEAGGYEDMLFAGASFQSGNVNAADPTGTAVAIRRALRQRGMNASSIDGFVSTVLDTPAKFWEKYRLIGEAIENSNRHAVFEAVDGTSKGKTAAVFEAKDLMDFNLRGSWPAYQLLADVLPFFNARVQGLYRLGRSDPKLLAAVGMLITAATVMLAFANDGEDWYEELPDWDRDTYWHFRIGEHHFRLPKPFELGVLFATVPERLGRSIKGLDTGKKTLGRLWANVRDQLAFDLVPQMFRPALNVAMNRDSFRDSPIETIGDEGKLPSSRYSARTSDTMRVLALAASPVADATGMSPKRLEYLVGGYLGTVGTYALGFSDMVVRELEGKPPGPTLRADDLPVVKSFYRVDPARSTVYESDLYKLREEAAAVAKTLRAHAREGDLGKVAELMRDKGDLLRVEPVVTSAAKGLSAFSKARDAIVADTKLTPKEKRERIDTLQVERNKLAKTVMTAPAVRATQ